MVKEFTTLKSIFRMLKKVNVRPTCLVIPCTLSLASAVFEGAGIGLLIPLLNGFLIRDFSFIKDAPVLSHALEVLPQYVLDSDRLLFLVLISIFVFMAISRNALRYLATVGMIHVAMNAQHNLRKEVFGRYLSFGKFYFDSSSVGYHQTVLTEFIGAAMRPIKMFDRYVNAFFSLAVYLIVMTFIAWELTIVALPLFLLVHLSSRHFILRIEQISHRIAERGFALGKKSVEVLSLVPLVKSYSMELNEKDQYASISEQKARLDFRSGSLGAVILPLQEIVTLLTVILLFCGMLYLMVRDSIATAPSFFVYFYLVLNASNKFGAIIGLRGVLAEASGPLQKVLDVFDDTDKPYVRGGSEEFSGLERAIEFRDLSFSYGKGVPALSNLSFSMDKGKLTAIVGPTGAGKTTIISLLMRFYDCPPETLFIDDVDIRSYTLPSLMKHIAIVSQDALLFHDSLRNNIAYGLEDVNEEDLQACVERARLGALVEKLPEGLDTFIGDRGVQLSGGEKQRISIARALLKGAEILILDEATSSLDSKTERMIQDAIDDAVQGRTAIVIAHRLSTIKGADFIVVVDEGTVAESGSLDELLEAKGTFYGLWEEQKFQ